MARNDRALSSHIELCDAIRFMLHCDIGDCNTVAQRFYLVLKKGYLSKGSFYMKSVRFLVAVAFVASMSSTAFAGETKVADLLTAGLDAIKQSRWDSSAQYNSTVLDVPGLSRAEEVVALNNLCIAMAHLPDTDKAMQACDNAIEAAPELWGGYVNRGRLRMATGALSGAYADFAHAKLLNPGHGLSNPTATSLFRAPQSQFLALRTLTDSGIQQAEAN